MAVGALKIPSVLEVEIESDIGDLTDVAADTTDTATIFALLRQIAEAVNNGTGTAIGSNLSLVDLMGAFDGGADPQGDIYQALGVSASTSIAGLLGALNDAAAAGAVTDADTIIAYIKQLVTAELAALALRGALTDVADDTTDTATMTALLRQIAEAVNNGTGTAIGSNLSLVDLMGAFDGGADPQGDLYQAIGPTTATSLNGLLGALDDVAVDTTDTATMINLLRQIAEAVNNGTGTAIGSNLSLVDLLGAFDGGADPQGDVFQALGVGTSDSIADILAGAAGISTYPAAAAAGDGVSLAEVLRYISEKQMSRIVQHEITFTAVGDGAVGAHDLFTVTGTVKARVVAICTTVTSIQAGATVEVGIAGSTASIIAQTAGDAPDANEIWHDASPDASIEADSVAAFNLITNSADIILTVGTDTVDSGVIMFYCEWMPISSDGAVTAA